MRPIYSRPGYFPQSLSTPTATFPEMFHGLLFRSILWMWVQNLKLRVALPVPDIIGGTQKIWEVPGYAQAPVSPKFWMAFVRIDLWIYLPNLKFVALPVPEIDGQTTCNFNTGLCTIVHRAVKIEGSYNVYMPVFYCVLCCSCAVRSPAVNICTRLALLSQPHWYISAWTKIFMRYYTGSWHRRHCFDSLNVPFCNSSNYWHWI